MTYTLPANTTTYPELFQAVNAMVGGDLLAISLIMSIFFISLFSVAAKEDFPRAVAISGFFAMITAMFSTVIFGTHVALIIIPTVIALVGLALIGRDSSG